MTGQIRINTHEKLLSRFWDVFLDDVEISHYLKNITITAGVDAKIPKVTLEFVDVVVNIPENIQGLIEAYRKDETHV